MAKEPQDKASEQKRTPNQQAVEDASWDIPGFRTILNLLYSEGQFVRNGWIAILVVIGMTVFFTWSCTRDAYKDKISDLKDDAEKANQERDQIKNKLSEKDGEIADARHDRDHYQEMLAPFEALALAKYTNAPVEQSMAMLAETIGIITNELESDKPVIHLEINGQMLSGKESMKEGEMLIAMPIVLNTNREIKTRIFCDSEITAEHTTVDFCADLSSGDVVANQWNLSGKSIPLGWNAWRIVAADSFSSQSVWSPQAIIISQNYNKKNIFYAQFTIHADRSKSWSYAIIFFLNKSDTNTIDSKQ